MLQNATGAGFFRKQDFHRKSLCQSRFRRFYHHIDQLECKRNCHGSNILRLFSACSILRQYPHLGPRIGVSWPIFPTQSVRGRKPRPLSVGERGRRPARGGPAPRARPGARPGCARGRSRAAGYAPGPTVRGRHTAPGSEHRGRGGSVTEVCSCRRPRRRRPPANHRGR